jgi:LysM repeat protein
MKTSSYASRALSSATLFWGIVFALPLSAQPNSYPLPPPPSGYPAQGAPAKQPSTRATRQSVAAIQAPVTHLQYPPPAGYTYPPGYGIPPKTASRKTSATKPAPHGKSSSKTSPSKKTAAGPPPPPKVYGPTGDITSQVSKIRDNDKVQNLRLGDLERDVSGIKRGGKGSARYDGGSDLAAHTTYIARPGDTLWRIASTHRVSVGEIQQLNRMTEEEVHVGQALLIPSPHRLDSPTTQVSYTPATPSGSAAHTSTSVTRVVSSPVYYTVKKGDSLKGIALKHKMTAVTLASANKIKNANKIVVGQRLKIPGRTTTVTVVSKAKAPRVQSSDTIPLPGFGVPSAPPPPAAGLAQAPAPMPTPPAPPAPPAVIPAAPKGPDLSDSHRGILAYRVDRSDSIESIATQFTTTPDHIREMNRLTPGSALKTGDEIMVPAMGAVSVSSR